MKKYDLIVIGGGAGLFVAEAAINVGLKCAIIEEYKLGGTCLTRGCIPTKIMVATADLIREAERANRVGLSFEKPVISWKRISDRLWGQINLSEKVADKLNSLDNVDYYNGTGSFVDEKTLKILLKDNEEVIIEGETIVIASGVRTFILNIEGLLGSDFITSETFFSDKYPDKPWESMVILGAGAIGAEFTHIFSSLGTKVSLVEMQDRILPLEEESISDLAKTVFESKGINVYTGYKAVKVSEEGGIKAVTLESVKDGSVIEVKGHALFISSGMKSNTDKLNIENSGVLTDERGYVITDKYLKTNKDHIYALGDINGKFQFRHKANYEAEIIINNVINKNENIRTASYDSVPWAIFTYPQIAHAGKTEREIREIHDEYYVGIKKYSQVAAGIALGYEREDYDEGFVKVIVSKENKLLGVHIAGPYASVLIQPFVYLMNSKASCIREKDETCFTELGIICPDLGSYKTVQEAMVIHPSLGELTAWAFNKLELKTK